MVHLMAMGKENNPTENRVKTTSKFADQNQASKGNVKGNGNIPKVKSSWGSQIVKGLSGEKKTKTQITAQSKKIPLASSDIVNAQSRAKRSLMGDLSCSVTSTQVHPQTGQRTKSSGSRDLFLEIDHLRSLLQESKESKMKLESEIELKGNEIDGLVKRVEALECEKANLSEELSKRDKNRDLTGLEMEVLELRRLNKELQLQKRDLSCRLSSIESQLLTTPKVSEENDVEKIKAEASLLRHKNESLCKQVEGLQMSRLNEVEELAYLRWENSCLRDELRGCPAMSCDKPSSPHGSDKSRESICLSSYQSDEDSKCSSARRLSLIKKLKKWPLTDEDISQLECQDDVGVDRWDNSQNYARRHSISGSKCCVEDLVINMRRQSDGFMCSKEVEKETEPLAFQHKVTASSEVERRALRVPNPPPRPSPAVYNCSEQKKESCAKIPPPPPAPLPPPPPPPPKIMVRSCTTGTVQRAPQVVEFYHSLMKRDSRKDSLNGVCDVSNVADVRSSMIGEIANRSSYLLAIKADVETQGEFVKSLIREVNNATFLDIEHVVAFVKWLDDELCFLVDERAVLKHFDWPESKADTLREAAFGYRDLKKLENEVSHYKDDPRLPCDIALKKMVALSEKMERTVYSLLRSRDSLIRHCKEFQIPTNWMQDNGILSKIKLGSVKLARMYMKRVAMELQSKGPSDKDTSMDYMLLQGVRFAFRIHQFAGGFDAETMDAFEELRDLALALNKM
ncbi:PREDICTED: protein CHUP1, chloroplastic-like isoform X1 [Ipomoea nil]|uniref:protein CHUP1, chloroplastic-like isoform X1 n=1 Tax=Ipomoea nil TaxID=35883 RepID=UPI00090177C3|nr:PREDICTED: protein CHUP1, chloroplastic-like isoform X1 [Ipomoea nil]XP_019178933.1 PREDICTED: protein CHUP1, chloroplastic-like isoform X1 [Ipomoea nil]